MIFAASVPIVLAGRRGVATEQRRVPIRTAADDKGLGLVESALDHWCSGPPGWSVHIDGGRHTISSRPASWLPDCHAAPPGGSAGGKVLAEWSGRVRTAGGPPRSCAAAGSTANGCVTTFNDHCAVGVIGPASAETGGSAGRGLGLPAMTTRRSPNSAAHQPLLTVSQEGSHQARLVGRTLPAAERLEGSSAARYAESLFGTAPCCAWMPDRARPTDRGRPRQKASSCSIVPASAVRSRNHAVKTAAAGS